MAKQSENIDIVINRSAKEISQFITALKQAELTKVNGKVQMPLKKNLYDLYSNVVLDAHLSAAIQKRKSLILGEKFKIINKNTGLVDQEKTKLFTNKKWFNNLINNSLDTVFYGYSLIELGDLNEASEISYSKLIPRQNTVPELNLITKKPNDKNGVDVSGFDDYLLIKNDENIHGLLSKLSPLVISKRATLAQWNNHTESYALPTMVFKTNVADETLHQNMLEQMQSIGRDKNIGLDKGDDLQILKTTADIYLSFREQVDIINNEISKLILGGILALDQNTSGTGSYNLSSTHTDSLLQLIQQDKQMVEEVINNDLLPKLKAIGGAYSALDLETDQFIIELDLKPSPQVQINLYQTLLSFYDIDEQQIELEFGIKADMLKKKVSQ